MSSSPARSQPSPPSSSSSQSPPRKRTRTSVSMIGEGPIGANAPANSTDLDVVDGGGSASASSSKTKLRSKSNGQESGHSGSNNYASDVEDSTSEDVNNCDGHGESTRRLLRKVPKKSSGLSSVDREVIRLIGQHLTNLGLDISAEVLMKEAGVKLDQPEAVIFKKHVLNGNWVQAVRCLDELKNYLENPDDLMEMKFLLYEQKFLDYLSQRNRIGALKVLQNEISPLNYNVKRTHELSTFIMSRPDELSRITRPASSSQLLLSRTDLMDKLQNFLPATIMLPPRRLTTLLQQATTLQIEKCLYHNHPDVKGIDIECLSMDHECSKEDLPCETMQILTGHSDEVWYCKFSPNGLKLATVSKDALINIWDFDPLTLTLKNNKSLERNSRGASYFTWSPDSTKLAVCGADDGEEVYIWNVDTGELEFKISQGAEDSLTAVTWSPNGQKIACAGIKGHFYQCDSKGSITDTWEGVRVNSLHYRKDGKTILASDTHNRIRSYVLDELTDSSLIKEDHGIVNFSLDKSDSYALINVCEQGIHLWDINNRSLVRKYTGAIMGTCTIYSCFGGRGESEQFFASGSEDSNVYIYHVKRESPIAVLSGHKRMVNAVSWNPVYHNVLVSCSDDNTIRLWGPMAKYRRKPRANKYEMNGSSSFKLDGGRESPLSSSSSSSTSHHYSGNGVL